MIGSASSSLGNWTKRWREHLRQKAMGVTTPTAKSKTHSHAHWAVGCTQSHNRKIKIKHKSGFQIEPFFARRLITVRLQIFFRNGLGIASWMTLEVTPQPGGLFL